MSKSGKNNRVRIIGGDWRGRRLEVADVPGLRPTGDRARETLFNWLQPWIAAADCADLFAGTGALGFEAASRGAMSVLMIEKDPKAQAVLRQSIEQLQAEQVNLHAGGAMSLLEEFKPNSFDLVFVDPPFGGNLMYSELSFYWEAWLRTFANSKLEAVINKVQRKALPEYQHLMERCFREFYRVLKPGRWMTVEFHNSQNRVWNAIQEAIEEQLTPVALPEES